ncbi:MAG: endo-polygalacturonase, partial [Planctomycetes bacterium]|nr:endo-polygalacturonase [Planctomycetota bacterium]
MLKYYLHFFLILISFFPTSYSSSLIPTAKVPGLTPSEHYAFRVRSVGSSSWQDCFAMVSRCKKGDRQKNAYFSELSHWTHTYTNFEMDGPVEIEIRRTNNQPIKKAIVRPALWARSQKIVSGRAYIIMDKAANIAVDIDGQMEDQDTGKGYKGPPIHTLSIHANPPILNKPLPGQTGVHVVQPGETAPTEGDWHTLYFAPGVHHVGRGFRLHAERKYYLCAEAIVYGTMHNNEKWDDGHNIRIYGLGTLSGAKVHHPRYDTQNKQAMNETHFYNTIRIVGAQNTSIEGITVSDAPYHAIMAIGTYKKNQATKFQRLKLFTWRRNADGINPFGNGLIEDCFLRTQDDSCYVNGLGIRGCVYWNDANGSAFVLTELPLSKPISVENCHVIYSRAKWHHWTGGRVFNIRGEGGGLG